MDESPPRTRAATVRPEYRALHVYLRDRYVDTVVLTFAQIEDLLGTPLPEVARAQTTWWTGDGSDGPQTQAWIGADRTALPNLQARVVRFERVSA